MKRSAVPVPEYMASLPVTDRGYLKPWFVKGDDFRIVDGDKAFLAANKEKCWICGNSFKPQEYGLLGDAISAMVRVCKEPPCHVECAVYALQVCPFILYPNAKRRTAGLAEDQTLEYGNKLSKMKIKPENPGKYFLMIVKDFTFVFKDQLMYYFESDVIERQFWIGGQKQERIPDPILPLDSLSPEQQRIYHETNR